TAISPRFAIRMRCPSAVIIALLVSNVARRYRCGRSDPVLTEHSVAEAVHAAGLPARSAYVVSTGSTNADLTAAGDAGAAGWTVLVAGYQEAGRGRMGRTWIAPPGSSLLASVLLRPAITIEEAPLVSMAAAASMAEAIEALSGVPVSCEWPND